MTVSPASSLHYDTTPRVSYRQFAPLVRIRTIQHRRRAVAMSLLVHGLALSLIASLPDRGSAPVAPSEPTVALMFAPPSAQIEPGRPRLQRHPLRSRQRQRQTWNRHLRLTLSRRQHPSRICSRTSESPKLPAPIMPPRAVASHPVVHPSQLPARATPSAQPPAANEITAAAMAPLLRPDPWRGWRRIGRQPIRRSPAVAASRDECCCGSPSRQPGCRLTSRWPRAVVTPFWIPPL